MNFVHIAGRLGKDAETRVTAQGQKMVVLTVACNVYKSGNEETIWYRIAYWGDRWDKMVPYLKKGSAIMVGGEMQKPEIYTGKDGTPQLSSIDVKGEFIKFNPFHTKNENDQQQGQNAMGGNQANPAANAFAESSSKGTATGSLDQSGQHENLAPENDQDMPF